MGGRVGRVSTNISRMSETVRRVGRASIGQGCGVWGETLIPPWLKNRLKSRNSCLRSWRADVELHPAIQNHHMRIQIVRGLKLRASGRQWLAESTDRKCYGPSAISPTGTGLRGGRILTRQTIEGSSCLSCADGSPGNHESTRSKTMENIHEPSVLRRVFVEDAYLVCRGWNRA